jgi:hypothetical protein
VREFENGGGGEGRGRQSTTGRLPPSEREGLTPTTTFRFPLAIMNVSRVQSRASSASDERDQVVLFGAFARMRVFRVAVLPRRTEN